MNFEIVILLIVNVATFVLYGIDKYRAKVGEWRVTEQTLLLSALCFGGMGALAGMMAFRHKTRKRKFKIFVPLFCLVQVMVLCYCGVVY